MNVEEKLDEILKQLLILDSKLDVFVPKRKFVKVLPDVKALSPALLALLLGLHTHLQKTALVLIKNGCMTADQVAHETTRARAVESSYLNQLEARGYVTSMRIKPDRPGGPVKIFSWQPTEEVKNKNE